MVSDSLKGHLWFFLGLSCTAGSALAFGYVTVVGLESLLEMLLQGELISVGGALAISVGSGVITAIMVYLLLFITKSYLDARTLIVLNICPECKESLPSNEIKWVEPEKAECPYCGVSLDVRKGWS
ncbi:MAG: hypothetical protein ACFFF4_19095 [Candidatus Thorarchaeota archaeon]